MELVENPGLPSPPALPEVQGCSKTQEPAEFCMNQATSLFIMFKFVPFYHELFNLNLSKMCCFDHLFIIHFILNTQPRVYLFVIILLLKLIFKFHIFKMCFLPCF